MSESYSTAGLLWRDQDSSNASTPDSDGNSNTCTPVAFEANVAFVHRPRHRTAQACEKCRERKTKVILPLYHRAEPRLTT